MPAEETTVAEVLQGAGYRTHFLGKWGLGGATMADDPHADALGWGMGTASIIPGQETSLPTRQGFDTALAYLNQLYALRPVLGWADHRCPVRGLYLCGAASHPGGGVMGVCGRNAAEEILRDA